MTGFDVPDFAMGDGRGFRISASAVASRRSPFTCPVGTALNARFAGRSLQPNDASRWRKSWDDASKLHFAIRDGFFRLGHDSIADIVERERTLTHAQRRFVVHALELLQDLTDIASADAGVPLRPAEELEAQANPPGMAGQVTLFARHLASRDAAVHEAVRMRLRSFRPLADDDDDWMAVAALVVLQARPDRPPARIRVSEFSLADGDYRVVFDGAPDDVRALYSSRGPLLPDALRSHGFNPGSNCGGCAFLNVCPAVPQRRGLLGAPRRAVATRSLSSADLAAYQRCPTAFLAQRRDHLPPAPHEDADDPGGAARMRGIAVHAVLAWLHGRPTARACSPEDLPDPDADRVAAQALCDAAGIDLEGYEVALNFLRQHLGSCPLGFDGLGHWEPESRVVVFDPDADIVAITTPDLVGEVEGVREPIWRETKTANTIPPDVEAAFSRYPGFALNIAILAAGIPHNSTNGHAELEVLTPTASELFHVATSDVRTVVLAQQVLADLVRQFAADLAFERKENGGCPFCPTYEWCQPSLELRAPSVRSEIDDDEFADDPPPF